jgi:hypothetical protein
METLGEFTIDERWLAAGSTGPRSGALSGALAAHEKAIVEGALRASGGRVAGPSGAAASQCCALNARIEDPDSRDRQEPFSRASTEAVVDPQVSGISSSGEISQLLAQFG